MKKFLTILLLSLGFCLPAKAQISSRVTATSIKNAMSCADTSVSANTITCSTFQGLTGYSTGETFFVQVANTTTGATTININSLGAKNVTKNGTTAIASGDLVANGNYAMRYDGTEFVVLGSISTGGSGSPGGSATQFQFNNAGAFGGIAGSSVTTHGGSAFFPTADTPTLALHPFATGLSDPFQVFSETAVSVPSTPATNQTAGGALASRTDFVETAYADGSGTFTTYSLEHSQAISANNLLTVTSPAASSGAAGWLPAIASTTGTETKMETVTSSNCALATGLPESAPAMCAIGATFTEPTTGFNATGPSKPASNLTQVKAFSVDSSGNIHCQNCAVPVSAGFTASAATPIGVDSTTGLFHNWTGSADQSNMPNLFTTLGDIMYAGASGAPTRLAGTTSATIQCLTQTGTGSVSAAPAWGSCGAGGGVTSFTGDGTILSNSASTGAVTATLVNALADSVLGNPTGSAATPVYTTNPVVGTITVGSLKCVSAGCFATSAGINETYQGGNDAGSTQGGGTYRGGDVVGGTSASAAGPTMLRGGNDSSASATSSAGPVEVLAGGATGTTQGQQGIANVVGSFVKGATVTQWNLETVSAAKTVTDAAASPGYFACIAEVVGTNQVQCVLYGETAVNVSNTAVVGDTVCTGTTAGKGTDSGGTTACVNGTGIGIVEAISGTWKFSDGTSFTASASLPLIIISKD